MLHFTYCTTPCCTTKPCRHPAKAAASGPGVASACCSRSGASGSSIQIGRSAWARAARAPRRAARRIAPAPRRRSWAPPALRRARRSYYDIESMIQMYNDALQNDEPTSVPSGRSFGSLLVAAQQIRIDCEEWIDSTTLGEGFVAGDWSVLEQIVLTLEYLLLQGKVPIKAKNVIAQNQ